MSFVFPVDSEAQYFVPDQLDVSEGIHQVLGVLAANGFDAEDIDDDAKLDRSRDRCRRCAW